MKKTVFERHPKTTLIVLASFLLLIGIVIANKLASSLFGLGKVVIYEANPIYGYRPKPEQKIARQAHHEIQINNLGLRAQTDWDPYDFTHKILFLGDSVTYGGSYIGNQQLFSYLIGQQFPKFTSGNAGVNGWGVNNVHAFVKELQFLPAQVYVSMFPEGDFYRGLNRIGGQPFWTTKPKSALDELFQYFIYKMQLKKNPGFNINLASDKERTLIVDIAARNLKDLDNYLKQNNRDHIIYITPSRSQLLGITKQDDFIKNAFEKYGLKVIYIKDKLGALSADEIKQLYHDEIHLSPLGHEKWAAIMSEDLKSILDHREKESLFVDNNFPRLHA
ncbi:MAG: SGNH/GDSL hydrolase family protein [Candidatus Berkiella sp.]